MALGTLPAKSDVLPSVCSNSAPRRDALVLLWPRRLGAFGSRGTRKGLQEGADLFIGEPKITAEIVAAADDTLRAAENMTDQWAFQNGIRRVELQGDVDVLAAKRFIPFAIDVFRRADRFDVGRVVCAHVGHLAVGSNSVSMSVRRDVSPKLEMIARLAGEPNPLRSPVSRR